MLLNILKPPFAAQKLPVSLPQILCSDYMNHMAFSLTTAPLTDSSCFAFSSSTTPKTLYTFSRKWLW
jgi:hypothetical protein